MLHCRGGYFYTGHTDELERRVGDHKSGLIPGFTADHLPVEHVWAQEFSTRDKAKAAEKQIKGWSRAKKLALIRGDRERISSLAKGKDGPSTSSGKTGKGDAAALTPVYPEPFEGLLFTLQPHPDTPPNAVSGVNVEIARSEFGQVVARYVATSETGSIKIPPPVRNSSRIDELWRATCFEAFVLDPNGEGYFEFNFSPSTGWAAYNFASYRQGFDQVAIDPPHFDVEANPKCLEVIVSADFSALSLLPANKPWRIALSAVIEETDGTKSYWALAHPPGKPDFHHPTCFAATLAPPSAS